MKPDDPVVLFLQCVSPGSGKLSHYAKHLQAQGFQVLACNNILALYRLAQANLAINALACSVLAGTHLDNCAAANYLRTLYPGLGIVAVADFASQLEPLQVLQSGADSIFPLNAEAPLLSAILFRLLWRIKQRWADATPPVAAGVPGWQLQEQAWVIVSPDGKRIPLTTGERAFLSTLMAAGGARASHAELTDAVNAAYALGPQALHKGRLGVLVSRMRRKFDEQGINMPLKSIHRWGYMFTGPL